MQIASASHEDHLPGQLPPGAHDRRVKKITATLCAGVPVRAQVWQAWMDAGSEGKYMTT
jgi:hypothetical protein